jgi:hypothetical protein
MRSLEEVDCVMWGWEWLFHGLESSQQRRLGEDLQGVAQDGEMASRAQIVIAVLMSRMVRGLSNGQDPRSAKYNSMGYHRGNGGNGRI